MKENNNIEDLFKEAFDNYELDPGDQMWSNIQSQIPSVPAAEIGAKAAASAAKAGSSWITTVIVGGSIGLISVAGYFYFENKAEKLQQKPQKEEIISQPENDGQNEPSAFDAEGQLDDSAIEAAPEESRSSKSDANLSETGKTEVNSAQRASAIDQSQSTERLTETSTDEATIESEAALNGTNETSSEQLPPTADQVVGSEIQDNTTTNTPIGTNPVQEGTDAESTEGEESKNADSSEQLEKSNGTDGSVTPPLKDHEVDETPSMIEAYQPDNAFSPNHDGVNDIFQADVSEMGVDAIEMYVYDRAGNLIHSWNEFHGYWDGKGRNGNNAPEGMYPYVLILKKDGKEYPKRGLVTLTR